MFDKLPTELSHYIFLKLTGKELNAVSTACKSWRTLINDNHLWKRICLSEGILDDNVPEEFSIGGCNEDETGKSFKGDHHLNQLCHWWNVYRFFHLRRSNWLYSKATVYNVRIMMKHVSMRGCFVAVTRPNADGAEIINWTRVSSKGESLESGTVDRVARGFTVNQIEIGVGNMAAVVNDYWSLVYSFEGKQFVLNAFINLIDCRLEDLSTETVIIQKENLFTAQILIIVEQFVWIRTAKNHILVAHRGKDSESKWELNEIKLLDAIAVTTDEENVAVLRPKCIHVHNLRGSQLYTINRPGYSYSGLTMNCGRLAYLCRDKLNDGGGVPQVYDLQTRSYFDFDLPETWQRLGCNAHYFCKLTLAHKGHILLCLLDSKVICFTLDCGPQSRGWRRMWETGVVGFEYLHQERAFLKLMCNSVVLVSCWIEGSNGLMRIYLMNVHSGQPIWDGNTCSGEGLIRVSRVNPMGDVACGHEHFFDDFFVVRTFTTLQNPSF